MPTGSSSFSISAIFFAICSGAAFAGECSADFADLRDADATIRFTVEIADTDAERSSGLMFRESMPMFAGMLFVYDAPHDAAFWMRNTLIPLDMLFMDETGTVRQIVENAEPMTDTPRLGGPGVKFVLEINGGLAAKLGLAAGAELRHPAIDPVQAIWKCAG